MFANFEPIPSSELDKLVKMSQQIMQASLESGDEQTTWCLRYSQKRKPDDNVSAVAKLIHVCSDYNAFRDDVHMAAYGEQGVDGMTWEAFSFVDDGNVKNASELFDQLAYRGWTIDEWGNALDCLSQKGWLSCVESGYQSTEKGKSIRQTVEQKTDALFYAPWDTLSQDKQVEYVHLLNKLNDKCMALISE